MQDAEHGDRWDNGLQCFLALRAVLGDLASKCDSMAAEVAALQAAVANLGDYLARDCFLPVIRENRQPTPYNSPNDFVPNRFTESLAPVRAALQQLEARLSAPLPNAHLSR